MHLIADIAIIPLGVGNSISSYVAACERVFTDAGLDPQLHANGTNVEGEWDEVFDAPLADHLLQTAAISTGKGLVGLDDSSAKDPFNLFHFRQVQRYGFIELDAPKQFGCIGEQIPVAFFTHLKKLVSFARAMDPQTECCEDQYQQRHARSTAKPPCCPPGR